MKQQLALTNGSGNDAPTRARSAKCVKRYRQWHGKFLASLAKSPSVALAARAARVSRRTVYNARDADPEFAEKWDNALNTALDSLEHSVFLRALKNDSQLAMFVLKAFRPFYRDSSKLEVDTRLCGVIVVP